MKEQVIKYEKVLNESESILDELEKVLEKFEKNNKNYTELLEYYDSDEFVSDVEISENTKEYEDISCGVLSEDGVYDLICRRYDVIVKMLEVATNLLREN